MLNTFSPHQRAQLMRPSRSFNIRNAWILRNVFLLFFCFDSQDESRSHNHSHNNNNNQHQCSDFEHRIPENPSRTFKISAIGDDFLLFVQGVIYDKFVHFRSSADFACFLSHGTSGIMLAPTLNFSSCAWPWRSLLERFVCSRHVSCRCQPAASYRGPFMNSFIILLRLSCTWLHQFCSWCG